MQSKWIVTLVLAANLVAGCDYVEKGNAKSDQPTSLTKAADELLRKNASEPDRNTPNKKESPPVLQALWEIKTELVYLNSNVMVHTNEVKEIKGQLAEIKEENAKLRTHAKEQADRIAAAESRLHEQALREMATSPPPPSPMPVEHVCYLETAAYPRRPSAPRFFIRLRR